MAVPPSAEVVAAIESGTATITRRCEIYEADGVTRWGPKSPGLIGGNISIDYSRDERRTIDLELDNSGKEFTPKPGGFWYDKVIKMFRGVTYKADSRPPRVIIIEATNNARAQETASKLRTIGYTRTTVMLTASSMNDISEYDIIVSDNHLSKPGKVALLAQAYAIGKKVITTGTTSTENEVPVIGSTRNWDREYGIWNPPPSRIRNQAKYPWNGQTFFGTTKANLVFSPGFDDISGGVSPYYNSTFSLNNTQQRSGGSCLQVNTPASTSFPHGAIFYPVMPGSGPRDVYVAQPGEVVTAQAWVKIPAGETFYACGRILSANGDYLSEGQGQVNYTGTGSYQLVQTSYTWGSSTWQPLFQIVRNNTPAASTFYVDDMTITSDSTVGQSDGRVPVSLGANSEVASYRANGSSHISSIIGWNANGGRWFHYHPDTVSANALNLWASAIDWLRNFVPIKSWEIQTGEYFVDRISESNFPYSIKITGRDATKKAINSKLGESISFTAGTSVKTIVSAVANVAGLTKQKLSIGSEVTGSILSIERGTDRWSIIKNLANSFNYELFVDNEGYLVARKYQDPTLDAINNYFKTGKTGNLSTFERSTNDSRLFNNIIVTGDRNDGGLPYYGQAKNTQVDSPTSIAKIGDRVYTFNSSFFTSNQQCEDFAKSLLRVNALESYEMTCSSIFYAWLEGGDIVSIETPGQGVNDVKRFLMDTVTMPIALGPVSFTGKRVTIVT